MAEAKRSRYDEDDKYSLASFKDFELFVAKLCDPYNFVNQLIPTDKHDRNWNSSFDIQYGHLLKCELGQEFLRYFFRNLDGFINKKRNFYEDDKFIIAMWFVHYVVIKKYINIITIIITSISSPSLSISYQVG